MRERWAITLALLSGALVVLMSAAFAAMQNPAKPAAVAAEQAADRAAARIAAGRRVFEAQDCMRCHSVAGEGSPRSPLDGIAAERSREELRAFAIGDDSIKDALSPRTLAAKRSFQSLPAEETEALADYLASLK